MTDHANELRRHAYKVGRPAGDIPAVMHAAAAHIEDLERRLREAEGRVAQLEAERAEREKQGPVAWYCDGEDGREYNGSPQMSCGRFGIPLYAAPPVTQERPVFWCRPRSDGGYDGPIHDSQIEQVRRESGAWVPLIARPIQPAKGN